MKHPPLRNLKMLPKFEMRDGRNFRTLLHLVLNPVDLSCHLHELLLYELMLMPLCFRYDSYTQNLAASVFSYVVKQHKNFKARSSDL